MFSELKLDNVRLVAKNFLAQGLNTAIALGFTIVGARLLSVADYGELRYIMTLLPLFMAFSLPSYDAIILRNTSLRGAVPLGRIFQMRVMAGLIGSSLILATTFFIRNELSGTLTFFLVATAILLPLFETTTGYKNYLIGRGLRQQSLDLLLQTRLICLLLCAFFLAGIYFLQMSMLYLYPAYLLANIISTFISFRRVSLRRFSFKFRKRQKTGPLAIYPAMTMTVATLVYTFAFSFDKLWVRHELGVEQLALYSLLVMVPQELAKLLDSMILLFYQKLFFNKRPTQISKMKIIYLLMPALVAAYAISFYYLSSFIFGPAYFYSFLSVLLSGFMIVSLSVEFLYNHKIFAVFGSNVMFVYSVINLGVSASAVSVGLYLDGINGLIIALILKQLFLPSSFLYLRRRIFSA